MRRILSLPMLFAALMSLLTPACKKASDEEASAVTEPAAAEPADANGAGSPMGADGPDDAAPADPAHTIGSLPLPEDWNAVSAQTPKGATVMMGAPSAWIEVKPPNESTHLVMGAPAGEPEAGMKITVVATAFDGNLEAFVDSTKTRLQSFAQISSEGPIRVGDTDAYEFVASWQTPVGNKDTVQLLITTGQEGIGLTCEVPPGELDQWRGRCDEIFATHKVVMPGKTPKP